jgi:hypothetical protein
LKDCRNAVHRALFPCKLGCLGLAYVFNGLRNDVYTMGFFTPSFYQRQLLATRLQGKLRGPRKAIYRPSAVSLLTVLRLAAKSRP